VKQTIHCSDREHH